MNWAAAGAGEGLDRKLRRRIGWLNGEGGFDGVLNYDKISEAADGCSGARRSSRYSNS